MMNEYSKMFQNWQNAFQQNPFQMPGMNQNFQMPQMPQMGQMPKFDMSGFAGMQRKNMEAFSAAMQEMTEGAQQIARKGAEFLRDNVEGALNATRDLMTTTTPDTNAAKQAEYAKDFVKRGMNQFREVSEMASKSQFGAFDIISKRMTQSIEETKKMADKKAA
jgi:phasin family protein